ncbi:MAG: hypothetical protein ABSH41_05645, partial [Syntrophobacteraceae bacterium]
MHGRIFSGRQVDLFLTGRFGDLTVYRAIECKISPLKAEHIDSFIAKLRLVRREYPSAQGTMVSAASFTDAITAQAAQVGIQLTLFRDLAAQLFDGHVYAQNIIREVESNERYPLHLYIQPRLGYDLVDRFQINVAIFHATEMESSPYFHRKTTGASLVSSSHLRIL